MNHFCINPIICDVCSKKQQPFSGLSDKNLIVKIKKVSEKVPTMDRKKLELLREEVREFLSERGGDIEYNNGFCSLLSIINFHLAQR